MSDTRGELLSALDECPCTGQNLDKLIQPAVLAVLAGGPLHGYCIVQRLAEMPMFQGHEPDDTGVYRFLKAMEDRGLVKSVWDTSDSGPAKKLFDLTKKGRDCLGKWSATLREYRQQIGKLLDVLERAASGARATAKAPAAGRGHRKQPASKAGCCTGKGRGGKTARNGAAPGGGVRGRAMRGEI